MGNQRKNPKLSENTAVQTAFLLAPSAVPNAAGNSQNQGVTALAPGERAAGSSSRAGGSIATSASKRLADKKMEADRGKAASARRLS